jgi:hypothetical protein
VYLASIATRGARERAPRLEVDVDVEAFLLGIKVQLYDLPWIDHAEPLKKAH